MKRGYEPKTALTPSEKLRVAAGYDLLGIDQHKLAFLFGVNQGRIAEAISDVRSALVPTEQQDNQIEFDFSETPKRIIV
jgi:hypothetical protein